MAKARNAPMSDTPASHPLPDCRGAIEPTVGDWRSALVALSPEAAADVRKRLEAEVCLTSRSAYLDYFTWVVIHGSGDTAAEQELEDLFRRSLAALTDRTLKGSVAERYDDFQSLRERVRAGRHSSQPEFTTFSE